MFETFFIHSNGQLYINLLLALTLRNTMPYTYKAAYRASERCREYGPSGLLLFALSLRFNIDDIASLATDCLTDGADDKKIDALFIDTEESGAAIIIQSYISVRADRLEAPANKASELNTAITWAFNSPLEDVPERIRSYINDLRGALKENKIENLEFWYVHNLNESSKVEAELRAVEASAKAALSGYDPESSLQIKAIEVGKNTIEEWYLSQSTSILIPDSFTIEVTGGYEIEGDDWKSYTTYISARWLYSQFQKYREKLFSANIRGYLGSRRSDKNINDGIKNTCKTDPINFWAYNNGITCLVNDYTLKESNLSFSGLSIINGAQTTGSIGSIDEEPNENAYVPCRFIKCEKKDVLENIIRYNNSQNKLSAADFRSNDPVQRRLREEFEIIPETNYQGRRGGAEDIIRRRPNLMPSDTVAQSLAAFHGNPILAYNRKAEIWERSETYSKFFNTETTATHIIFTYSLLRAIERKKKQLKENEVKLTGAQIEQLNVLRYRGSIQLLVNAISHCLETFMDRRLPNLFRLSFGVTAPETAKENWTPIVDITLPFCNQLLPALEGGLKNPDRVEESIRTYRGLVEATKLANKDIISEFTKNVIIS